MVWLVMVVVDDDDDGFKLYFKRVYSRLSVDQHTRGLVEAK